MTEKFMNLSPKKQERIIKAALREFTDYPYEQSSTNRIVKEAKIGKGMLFYYFQSKKELYYFIVDYGIDYIRTEYLDQIDDTITDFIKRYKAMSKLKIEAYSKNPEVFNFFGTLYVNNDMIISEELEQKLLETRKSAYQKLFANIDKSLFREDIDPDEGIRLVRLSMDGYEKELLSELQGKKLSTLDMAPYWEDFYRYLGLLEQILYK